MGLQIAPKYCLYNYALLADPLPLRTLCVAYFWRWKRTRFGGGEGVEAMRVYDPKAVKTPQVRTGFFILRSACVIISSIECALCDPHCASYCFSNHYNYAVRTTLSTGPCPIFLSSRCALIGTKVLRVHFLAAGSYHLWLAIPRRWHRWRP